MFCVTCFFTFSSTFVPFLCPTPLPIFLYILPQGFDPPHQSDTRTVYVANRFPQHGHYIPQRFADNRIISSKVLYIVESSAVICRNMLFVRKNKHLMIFFNIKKQTLNSAWTLLKNTLVCGETKEFCVCKWVGTSTGQRANNPKRLLLSQHSDGCHWLNS